MRRNRQLEISVVLILAFVLNACGAAREKAIRTAFEVANTTEEHVTKYAREHEQSIADKVHDAETGAAATAELATFRPKVDKVLKSVAAVYTAIDMAAMVKSDLSVAAMMKAVAQLVADYKELTK